MFQVKWTIEFPTEHLRQSCSVSGAKALKMDSTGSKRNESHADREIPPYLAEKYMFTIRPSWFNC